MEYRFVGASDLKVSALSFGTATFGGSGTFFKAWGETDVPDAKSMVDMAIESGVNFFDSADIYSGGLAEEILGKAINGRRNKLLLSTKASMRTGPGAEDVGSSWTHLVLACEASLRRLGTDHIDLWQLHAFDALTPVDETLRALDHLVQTGKVLHVGCSNFSGWHLMKSLAMSEHHGWPRHIAHQAHYSLLAREYEWELMPLALDQKVGTLVWSPLSGGLLTGKVGPDMPPPPGSRLAVQGKMGPIPSQAQFYKIIEVLRSIATETGKSISQISINWLLQRPSVSSVIVGARNATQLKDNLGAVSFTLSAEHMNRLDAVSHRPATYPYWHQRATFSDRNPPPVS